MTTVCKLVHAVDQYNIEKNKFPTQSEGLQALKKSGVLKKVPKDPWGNNYVYRQIGKKDPNRPDIFSLGVDGKLGGKGSDKDIYCDYDDDE